jgi:hypothetical protein
MTRFLVLVPALVAALGLAACGAGPDSGAEPAAPTESSEAPEAALPDVARIVCAADGAQVETSAVKPRPDGVHVEFVNETGSDLAYSIEDPSGSSGMGANVPAGGATEILDLRPGTVSVACEEASTEGSGGAGAPLEIVDRDGLWIPADLACGETFTSMILDYAAGSKGEADPHAAAQKALEQYAKPGDVVEPAGYPEAATRHYRLTRAGEVQATVDLFDDGAGGWLPNIVSGCASLQR